MSEDWRVPKEDEDPLLRSARTEMKVAVIYWVVFAVWAIGLGKMLAYQKHPEGEMVDMILGMPSWVFWVVMLPWFFATVFTIWFALRFMKDHDLLADSGMNEDGAAPEGKTAVGSDPEATPIIESGVAKDEVGKKEESADEEGGSE